MSMGSKKMLSVVVLATVVSVVVVYASNRVPSVRNYIG